MRIRIAWRICTALLADPFNKHGYHAQRKDSQVTFVKCLALPVSPAIKIERERERDRERERAKAKKTKTAILKW
jgi:hypothetical protein